MITVKTIIAGKSSPAKLANLATASISSDAGC
jgi:hypothetical protein